VAVARVEYLKQLDWLFMTYLFLVGLAHALVYRGESERRALDSAHLEMRLVEAQLQALQRQLHPHFLFNTLNAIAGLMRTDVDAADRMMDRLGDLLRMTLQTSNIQEVPLKEELELLQKYLDIEQVRFGNRLAVVMTIDPDTLDALVPNFLLQPLVENAVRHGIAPHSRSGRLAVHADRDGERLSIRIVDRGDGVPPHRLTLLNQGVGLANTRARLEHLYRGDHSLVFSNADGGFCVTVSPFAMAHGSLNRSRWARYNQDSTLVVDDEPIARERVSLLRERPTSSWWGVRQRRQAVSAIERRAPTPVPRHPDAGGERPISRARSSRAACRRWSSSPPTTNTRSAPSKARVDYLLAVQRRAVPIGARHARDHVQRRKMGNGAEASQGSGASGREPGTPRRNRLMIKANGRIHFVRMTDIDWCDAAGNYVRIHVGPQEHLVRDTMNRLESELDPQQFVRIHRSTCQRRSHPEMQSTLNGEHAVQLAPAPA
jgi:hypothetical protein